MSQAWSQYRQGLVYSLQHNDFDSAIYYIHGMAAMLPERSRPNLEAVPQVNTLSDDFANRATKWAWLNKNGFAIEDAISRWIHNNFNRSKLGG